MHMRSAAEVARKIADKIPDAKLKKSLNTLIESDLEYKDPRDSVGWTHLVYWLEKNLGIPDTDWKKDIQKIFNNKA